MKRSRCSSYYFTTDKLQVCNKSHKVEVLYCCENDTKNNKDECIDCLIRKKNYFDIIYCPCITCSKAENKLIQYTKTNVYIHNDIIKNILTFLPKLLQNKAKCLASEFNETTEITINFKNNQKSNNLLMPGNSFFGDVLSLSILKHRKNDPEYYIKLQKISQLRCFRDHPNIFDNIMMD